jgi:3',5'-cyclic AMP phosphodiesterase CpdA
VRTLARPKGALRATVVTTNDVHFGEVECGKVHDDPAVGPILRALPGEPPYPETMNRGVIDEMLALDPDAVVVKGDLTNIGSDDEYAAFLAAYGRLGARMRHVRGNHDAMLDPTLALEGAPFTVDVGGVTLAVLVFGHHHLWDLDATERSAAYFGVNPVDSEAFGAVVAEHENIVGYFAGHTHRNRVRRSTKARDVPFVEISCTKDYPGAWAEYGLYEDGFTQVVRRISSPAALSWTERTRVMYHGLYRDYALGHLDHRCFTETW